MDYDLERYVEAQDAVWEDVCAELCAGRKRSHWMWFVFPQVEGLGRSATSLYYALVGRGEARAYFEHQTLGPRLRQVTKLMLSHEGRDASDVLGGIDAAKFRSSMTLFEAVAPEAPEFSAALDAFFGGRADARTLELLEASPG